MSRDYRLYLDDMLDAGNKLLRYTDGMTIDDFLADDKTFDAVVRNLQIIGEAAASVPTEVRNRHAEVPWREIIGFRNVVVHNYFGVDEEIIWQIVDSQVSPLLQQVQSVLDLEESE